MRSTSSTCSGAVPTTTASDPAVLVCRPLRPHRVGQAALLAHLLEQPARQAAARARGSARPGPSAARRSARPSACRRRGGPARSAGGPRRGRTVSGPGARADGAAPPGGAGEAPLEVGRHRVVACSRRPPRPPCWTAGSAARRSARMSSRVMRCTDDAVPRVSRPSGWPGKRAACHRSAARSAGSSACIRISSRITVRSASMSSGRRAGVPHDVAQDVEAERQVLGQQADVEGRVLLGGEGVAVAAHLVELLGDGRGGAPLGALEQQVLEEVRRPGQLVGLVTRAGTDPVADGDRADIRHGLGDQADAARQNRCLDQRRARATAASDRGRRRGRRRGPAAVVPGVGRARAEVAQVRHQLGLEGVLEGRPVGRAWPAGPDAGDPEARRGRRSRRAGAGRGRGPEPLPEDDESRHPRGPRPATARPCPAGRCRRHAPRRAGPATTRPRRC